MTWYSFLGGPTERLVFSDPKLDVRIRIVENGLYALVAELTALQRRLDSLEKQPARIMSPLPRVTPSQGSSVI